MTNDNEREPSELAQAAARVLILSVPLAGGMTLAKCQPPLDKDVKVGAPVAGKPVLKHP